MNNETHLSIVSEGNTAGFVYTKLKEYIGECQAEALNRVIQEYRGSSDPHQIKCLIAEYCALETFEKKMLRKINKGNQQFKEMLNESVADTNTPNN